MDIRVAIAALAFLAESLTVQASELNVLLPFWRESAFVCSTSGPAFPSKEVLNQRNDCDDGDMTLFNGLLCASGEKTACDAVRRAQGPDGRWWRSPRRIGWESPKHDVSFSPDQSLGVLLYTVATNEKDSFVRWLEWIENNRACAITIAGRCVQRSWLRFCRDDDDKRCTFRPADCVRIEMVAKKLGVDGNLCRRVMKELQLPEDILLPIDDFLLSSAVANELGYPLHLAGVGIFLAQQMGFESDRLKTAAEIVAARQGNNPFFQFLAAGKTPKVQQLLLSNCPAPDRKSTHRFQWMWERETKDEAWRESMYWDCVFLARLLT